MTYQGTPLIWQNILHFERFEIILSRPGTTALLTCAPWGSNHHTKYLRSGIPGRLCQIYLMAECTSFFIIQIFFSQIQRKFLLETFWHSKTQSHMNLYPICIPVTHSLSFHFYSSGLHAIGIHYYWELDKINKWVYFDNSIIVVLIIGKHRVPLCWCRWLK